MDKKYLLLFYTFCFCVMITAQQNISGVVVNAQTQEPIWGAVVKLLKGDTTFVQATTTKEKGLFNFNTTLKVPYSLSVAYIGYKPFVKSFKAGEQSDTLYLQEEGIFLQEASVVATQAKVEQKEDTTVFNANAFKIPEGSNLEALIAQLPGIEIDENGTIKWNGKVVKEFLTNGKDFFKGNTNIALKNVPSSLVNKIKAYDRKSDYTQQTGINDGEEVTVLDLTLKKELNETWFSNLDVGYGTQKRYQGKLFLNYFNEQSRLTILSSVNNVNDKSFGYNTGRFGGNKGVTAVKTLGLDYTHSNNKKRNEAGRLEIGGNFNVNFSDNITATQSNTERFSQKGNNTFLRSDAVNKRENLTLNAQMNLSWNPDSLTFIVFRPEWTFTKGKTESRAKRATFKNNPFEVEDEAKDWNYFLQKDSFPSTTRLSILNTNVRQTLSFQNEHRVGSSLHLTRRLNAKGRNLSFRGTFGYNHQFNENFNFTNIYYNRTIDSWNLNNQYQRLPQTTYNYSLQLGYTEPITKNLSLEFRQSYSHRYNEGERVLYNLDLLTQFNTPTALLGVLPKEDSLAFVRNEKESRFATYFYNNHNSTLTLNYRSKELFVQMGVDLQPQYSTMKYKRGVIDTVLNRSVFNKAPRIRVRYRFSGNSNVMLFYTGRSSQPSMTNLLDVTDNTDPLHIVKGNPGLKPSWSNRLFSSFNHYWPQQQRGINFTLEFSKVDNAISNATSYDSQTGVATTQPENINGNWSLSPHLSFNTPLTKNKKLTLHSTTAGGWENHVGFLRTSSMQSEKSTTVNQRISQQLKLSYRLDWLEVGAMGQLDYNHATNKLSVLANQNIKHWNYGVNTQINLPMGFSLATDVNFHQRRGYIDAQMNTNECIWNAQLSYAFLKQKQAVISIQAYDLLKQQSNLTQILNAEQRTETWSNAINSYFMVHFIYKLNLMQGSGGKKNLESGDGFRFRRNSMGGMPMRPMMH